MEIKEYLSQIINELNLNKELLDNQELNTLITYIENANHIFLSAKGRSGLMISAFANRLLHLGKSVSLVGEISSPHSKANDLLIIGSGSGETDSLVSLAKKAKKSGLYIILLTMNRSCTISEYADHIVYIPGLSKNNNEAKVTSIQPMGSSFEQLLELTLDAVVLKMMSNNCITSDDMLKLHADFE